MQRQVDTLFLLSDSLARYRLELPASQIRASLDALRSAARRSREEIGAPRAAGPPFVNGREREETVFHRPDREIANQPDAEKRDEDVHRQRIRL